MNTLRMLESRYYKIAFDCGLTLSGTEEGRPQWLGSDRQMSLYWNLLDTNNLI
jgi:hypothetical protein